MNMIEHDDFQKDKILKKKDKLLKGIQFLFLEK